MPMIRFLMIAGMFSLSSSWRSFAEEASARSFSLTLRVESGSLSGRIYKMTCPLSGSAQFGQALNENELELTSAPTGEVCDPLRKFMLLNEKDLKKEAAKPAARPFLAPHAPWGTLDWSGTRYGVNPNPTTVCTDAEFKDCHEPVLSHAERLSQLLRQTITQRLGPLHIPRQPAFNDDGVQEQVR